jgi:hypothetical protein
MSIRLAPAKIQQWSKDINFHRWRFGRVMDRFK